MRKYELRTIDGLSYQSWLINRAERTRFAKILRAWRTENPKATITQELLVEELVRLSIFIQRLVDRRFLFDGQPTDYQKVADHDVDVSSDDLAAKQREFDKYFERFEKLKLEYLKLALANGVTLNIHGEAKDLSSLFGALDATERNSMNGNGNSNAEKRI